jgi:hypothetical protein
MLLIQRHAAPIDSQRSVSLRRGAVASVESVVVDFVRCDHLTKSPGNFRPHDKGTK